MLGWMSNVLVSLDQFLSFEEITVHNSSGLITIFYFFGLVHSRSGGVGSCGGEGEKVFRFCGDDAHRAPGGVYGLFGVPDELAVVVIDALHHGDNRSAWGIPLLEERNEGDPSLHTAGCGCLGT